MSEFFKKKSNVIIIAVVAVVLIIAIAFISGYNSLVNLEQEVENKKSQVSVQLQRRADLIPNLVKVAKQYSNYEQETLTAVTNARTAVNNATTFEEKDKAAAQLDTAIDVWVSAVTEAYPELTSNEQYKELMYSLEGTENRISTARKDYSDAVKEYNTSVRRFPKSIVAGMFGFEKVEYFEATPGAENAVDVNDSFNS